MCYSEGRRKQLSLRAFESSATTWVISVLCICRDEIQWCADKLGSLSSGWPYVCCTERILRLHSEGGTN